MSYARWATKEEVAKKLEAVNLKTGVKTSGIPIMYDDEFLYVDSRETHNLLIGSTGSGKTQATILPMLRLSMMAGESFVLNDPTGEICELTQQKLKEEGYNVITLDFKNPKLGNSWNPLELPYNLYIKNEKDNAIKLVEDLGYYLFFDPRDKSSDPFWVNSTIDYFTGLVLYLFENAKKEEIHLSSVSSLSESINQDVKKFIEGIDKSSTIYFNLAGTLNAPNDTRGSIVSVFNQKLKNFTSREELSNMLSSTNFDINNISNQKTALFIVSGITGYSGSLIPLLVTQIIECVSLFGNKEKSLNILLDEFDSLIPIRDFTKTIAYCRTLRVRITVTIRSYAHLGNMYSKEDTEILKMCFGNIVYLLSEDIYTLEEISKLCGNQEVHGKIVPLITVEELKTLNQFEAIILMTRTYPIKTKLLPDYKIDYGYELEKTEIAKRDFKEVSKFKLS